MNERDTPTALLLAAQSLFSRKGFRGTSVRELTGKAQVNLGAITYHFGSKEGLYHALLESIFAPLAATLAEVELRPGAPLDRIDTLVSLMTDHLERHPAQVGLIRHELALERPLPTPLRHWLRTLYGVLGRMIRAGQEDGSIVPGDAGLLAAGVLAQPFYFAMARHALAAGAGLPVRGRAGRDRVHAHIRNTVRRSLETRRRSS